MKAHVGTAILAFIVALHVVNASIKVLHIPEKIIGGVIDIVQSHKNKPSHQEQNQQQTQQGFGWNSGYQTQNQNQIQYGNYGYPQTGNPQGGYINNGQAGPGYQPNGQAQNVGQYQNYPQNPSGSQYQVQNQQSSGHQSNQYQNQVQNGFQGQQNQGSYVGGQPSGSYVNNPSGNYGNQGQQSNKYGASNVPQGQLTQTTSFVGQNHQSSQYQTGTGSYGGSQGFQTSTGAHPPGPTCVCQAWTKPQNDELNESASQRNEEHTQNPVGNQ